MEKINIFISISTEIKFEIWRVKFLKSSLQLRMDFRFSGNNENMMGINYAFDMMYRDKPYRFSHTGDKPYSILHPRDKPYKISYTEPVMLDQSDTPSDWYSGGCGFDPRVRQHIFRSDLVMK